MEELKDNIRWEIAAISKAELMLVNANFLKKCKKYLADPGHHFQYLLWQRYRYLIIVYLQLRNSCAWIDGLRISDFDGRKHASMLSCSLGTIYFFKEMKEKENTFYHNCISKFNNNDQKRIYWKTKACFFKICPWSSILHQHVFTWSCLYFNLVTKCRYLGILKIHLMMVMYCIFGQRLLPSVGGWVWLLLDYNEGQMITRDKCGLNVIAKLS